MNCPECNHENEESAMRCRYCGSPMHQIENKESNVSSVLIFIWIVATCVLYFAGILIVILDHQWFKNATSVIVFHGIYVLLNILNLLPAFAIKNEILKFIGIIIMSIMTVWLIIKNIHDMIVIITDWA